MYQQVYSDGAGAGQFFITAGNTLHSNSKRPFPTPTVILRNKHKTQPSSINKMAAVLNIPSGIMCDCGIIRRVADCHHLARLKNQNRAPSVISPPPGCTGSSHQSGATWSQRSGSARSQTPGTFLGTALQCSTIALLRMCCKTHTQMMEILHCELKDCEVNS